VTAYYPYSTAIQDPYAGVDVDPSDMKCATGSAATLDDSTSAATLANYNCFSSLLVNSNKTLTIPDSYNGPIYINGGSATFRGNFTCKSCTIVLTNSDTSSTATIGNVKANANANVNITAPTSGPYQGLAFYQDRRASDCNNCNLINGNSNSLITGAMYFPNQELQYNGTGNTNSVCSKFVAKRITFTGNSGNNQFAGLKDCTNYWSDGGTLTIVRLVA
ncbi:hypothetical protein ABDK56_00005, partial [Sphingomonas sp. ASV193]